MKTYREWLLKPRVNKHLQLLFQPINALLEFLIVSVKLQKILMNQQDAQQLVHKKKSSHLVGKMWTFTSCWPLCITICL